MSYNVNAIKGAIVGALRADATLVSLLAAGTASIYDAPAPQGTDPPYVTFQKITGTANYTLAQRAYDDNIWLIKGITTGTSKQTGGSIAERLNAALTDATLTGAMSCRRESDVEYPEADRGETYHHIGATFRIFTS